MACGVSPRPASQAQAQDVEIAPIATARPMSLRITRRLRAQSMLRAALQRERYESPSACVHARVTAKAAMRPRPRRPRQHRWRWCSQSPRAALRRRETDHRHGSGAQRIVGRRSADGRVVDDELRSIHVAVDVNPTKLRIHELQGLVEDLSIAGYPWVVGLKRRLQV